MIETSCRGLNRTLQPAFRQFKDELRILAETRGGKSISLCIDEFLKQFLMAFDGEVLR